VPPVSDLDGVRRAAGAAVGVAARPVPADQLGARALGQPGGERVSRPLGQDIDRAAALHVDQDRAVAVAAAQRELIDAQHPRRRAHHRIGQGADQADQRHPADPGR
jgi:hypothetical protein